MSNHATLLKQALAALEYHREQTRPIHQSNEAIEALRAALEIDQLKPVATPHNPEIHMPKDPQSASAISLASLPAIGTDLEGGTFAGLTTKPDGTHCAVVLLPVDGADLTWAKAKAWAKKQGGELPSRPVAALLFANVKSLLKPRWHWTSDEYDASYAWGCYFLNGSQSYDRKGYGGSAVAVRQIPLTA